MLLVLLMLLVRLMRLLRLLRMCLQRRLRLWLWLRLWLRLRLRLWLWLRKLFCAVRILSDVAQLLLQGLRLRTPTLICALDELHLLRYADRNRG